MPGTVLIVDDDNAVCRHLSAALTPRGFDVHIETSAARALHALEEQSFDSVVTDIQMPGMSGIELTSSIHQNRPEMPVVVITAFGNLEAAVAAIRVGAYDFVTKPVDIEALSLTLERAIQHARLREEVSLLRRAVSQTTGFEELDGVSPPMKAVCALLERLTDSEASVLITGESGTGKEVVARAIHRRSRRGAGPFVAVNCAAMPEALLESELFGHAKGAFTDAKSAHPGLFVQASGGTLFLDEIGDMPVSLQPKLLRAVQEKVIRPVGSTAEVRYDARIIAATNRDIESAIEERRFRQDLYFRINVIQLALPPLRSRGADVLLLARRFVDQFAVQSQKCVRGIANATAERLLAYGWPGNVRELQNCMERAVALTRHDLIMPEDLPEKIRDHKPAHVIVAGDDPFELVSLEEVERRYILRALEACGGNKSLAARVLGLDRKTLYRKLELYGAIVEFRDEPSSSRGTRIMRPKSS